MKQSITRLYSVCQSLLQETMLEYCIDENKERMSYKYELLNDLLKQWIYLLLQNVKEDSRKIHLGKVY